MKERFYSKYLLLFEEFHQICEEIERKIFIKPIDHFPEITLKFAFFHHNSRYRDIIKDHEAGGYYHP